MQEQVKRGQAPKEVQRVDQGNIAIPNNKDHIHFKDNTALNYDGSLSHEGHGVPKLSRQVKKWIINNGWNLPK